MSHYLLIPNSEQIPLPDLSLLFEASKPVKAGNAQEVIQAFLELAGGALSRFQSWSLLEVSPPEAERLQALGEVIGDQIASEGVSVLNLEKHLTLAEILTVASESGYSVSLVAVVKPSTPKGFESLLFHTLKAFGGRVNVPMIHRRLKAHSLAEIRAGLERLVEQGLIVKGGNSVRWAQYAVAGLEGQHWLEVQILKELRSGPLSSSQICNTFQAPISSVFEPLATLQARGLIAATGKGPNRRYRLSQSEGTCSGSLG